MQIPRAPRDGVPSPRFCLALLGGFELSGPAGVVDLPGGKLIGLLTYLACTAPRPQSREKLSALLWGPHFDAQAKQNLRQALSRLRRMLGRDALESDGEVVWLNPAALECDVSRFETLVREGSRDALSAAADLYRGRLIDDVAVREEGWSEWLAAERERLSELALGALVRLGEQELAAGRAAQALKAGRRAVALNDMREDAHRLVVRGLVTTGRRAEALKHYQGFASLLKRELNAEPDATTRSLMAELGRTQSSTGSQAARGVAKPVAATRRGDGPSPAATAQLVSSERRQLTIIACHMVDAIALSARLDPEDMHALIGSFHECVANTVARFDGFVAQYLSDGVLVHFGYPTAREHDADQAVRAGLAVRDAVSMLRTASGVTLKVRVGIATGLVVVGEQLVVDTVQRVAIGETPSLATRLQAVASPGEVVIAASTRRLVGRMFECRLLPAVEMRGAAAPIEAWLVLGENAGVGRFEALRGGALSPLVGRREEMDLLLRRWRQARSGEGQIVLLSGEAGIGKSRIAEDLRVALGDEALTCLRYFCSPHSTSSPLHPLIGHLEVAARFEAGDDAGAKLDKLEAVLRPTSMNLSRDVALVAELLGVPPREPHPVLAATAQHKREMLLAALVDQIAGLAAHGPLLVVFEDAHWIDPTSLDLADRMIARVANLPVLLVGAFRPEFRPSWVGQPNVTMLALNRLGRRDSAKIMAGIAGGKALPDAVVEHVLAHGDGVPLFIEELTSTLLESGLLRETADRYVLDGPMLPLAIPTTLQASLTARLDRLGLARDVAQIGAAIGREFSHELVAAVSAPAIMDLDGALERLTASGLVSRRGMPPHATYLFKHALVQDAAYSTLLRGRRRQLHSSIGNALVERFPAMVESQPEVVAHHFTEAGLASEAVGYWRKAGQLASARSANREAVASFRRALDLLETQPETRERLELAIDLRFDLRTSSFQLGEGFEQIIAYSREAEGLARRLNDQRRLGQASDYLCHVSVNAGRTREAIGFGRNAQAIADSLGDLALQVTATLNLGWAYHFAADERSAEQLIRKVLGLLDGDLRRQRFGQSSFPAVAALSYLTWIFAEQGRFAEAIAHGEEAVRLAEELNHPYSEAIALWCVARPHTLRGDIGEAIRLFERGVVLTRERNLGFLSILIAMGLGHGYALSGRIDEAIALLKQALKADEAVREQAMLPLCLICLGEAYVLAGQLDDALPLVRRALTLATEHDQGGYEVRALYVLGEIATRSNSLQQAEGHYRDSLALAQTLGFRPLIAHCHLGLGKLYRRTGALERAEEHLGAATEMYRTMGMTYWLERARV